MRLFHGATALAVCLALGTDLLYLRLAEDGARTTFIAISIAVAAGLLVAGALLRGVVGSTLVTIGVCLLLTLGVLGILSIGLLLVVAALLAVPSIGDAVDNRALALRAAAVVCVVGGVLLGIVVTG